MVSDKLAHLQGFIEGSDIDPNTKEGKIIFALTSILEDVIDSITMLEEEVAEIGDQVDDIDEDLQSLEDIVYDYDEDDECGCDDCCDCDDDVTYEITCPNCENTICIDEDVLDKGSVTYPSCGELLEFEIEEDDCGCGCGCHDDDEDEDNHE